MAEGKWIQHLTAKTPLAEAARHVLEVRLGVVRDRLPAALHEADRDPEHVHQLRVGTRRARAALDIFQRCLPAKAYKKTRKKLRKLRRAAGAARDWDVFLAMVLERAERAPERQQPGLDFLVGYARGQRDLAQDALQADASKIDGDRLVKDALAAVGEPESHHSARHLIDLARPLLTQLLAELERAAVSDLHLYEHLHQVRILGKRLRYAMEILEGCFTAPFRDEYYPAVVEMQELLGQANDSYVASQRLAGIRDRLKMSNPQIWKRYQPGVEGLLRYHQRRLPQQRGHFETWWRRWQQSKAEEAFFQLLTMNEGALRTESSAV